MWILSENLNIKLGKTVEGIAMVYCTKCGTKNKDDARVCVQCGAPLVSPPIYPPERIRREAEECFGVPKPWFLPFIGVVIILAGVAWFISQLYRVQVEVWPIAAIIFGILIILAAILRPKR